MSGMKDSEASAIREMANAARRSSVRLAQWLEDAPTSRGRVARLGVRLVHGGPSGRHTPRGVAVDQGRDIGTVCLRRGVVQRDREAEENQDPWAGQCQLTDLVGFGALGGTSARHPLSGSVSWQLGECAYPNNSIPRLPRI